MKKALEIFRPGKHTALNGQILEFGEADLLATIKAYNPELHEAPLVVGHPKIDAPAYGWVKVLSFAEGAMSAEPDQVDVAFAELVNKGRFKKISASFYLPDAPGNPVPGVYYLRHVGFLGAQPPAVKGLKNASFAASEEGVVEFGQWEERTNAGLWRNLRDFLIGKFGLEEADRAIPDWDVDTLAEAAVTPPVKIEEKAAQMFAEGGPEGSHHNKEDRDMPTPEELAAQKLADQQKEASFAEREAKLLQREQNISHQDHLVFAEGLVKEGKMLPAKKEQAVALLDFAASLAVDQVIEFGEGDGKKSMPPADLFKAYLADQPKVVEFGEIAKTEVAGATVEFAAAPGFTVDAAALETHNKALAYQGAHPGVEYMAAVRAVS